MKVASTIVIVAVVAIGARAETIQQKGKRIVDEAAAALGGQAFLNMQNRVESGRIYGFYRGKLTGMSLDTLYTTYLKRPSSASPGFIGERRRDARGKKQDDVILYTDGAGYEITFRGARPLSDAVLSQYRIGVLHNIFYILRQRLDEPGMIFESRGPDFFDNRPVEIVDITDADNNVVTVYFDQMTKLPARQTYNRRDPIDGDRLEEVSIFDKYRDVGGGVMWPFNTRQERNGDKIFERFSESVEINKDLADSMFVLPSNLKILKKEQ
ncbi:MAG TPA: hypothetical protein VMT86_01780 [Bryobacteraceae bacterium]|nr:hypothetical protein [Bryobacteraceae bacterium]